MSNVVFHVVNSIKGGSGKSTFSLLLADYYISKNELAYIIDLDISGSSWKDNYENYMNSYEQHNDKPIFLNELMHDFDRFITKNYIQELSILHVDEDNRPIEKYEIPLCVFDPSKANSLNEEEVDLFENVIYKLIMNIYDNKSKKQIASNTFTSNNNLNKNLNIIFDMPPSYEKHSERILKHLLLDISSPLYKVFCNDIKNMYKLNLYMLSTLSPAHINANKRYISDFYLNMNYSSITDELIPENFKLCFVINDLNNIIDEYYEDAKHSKQDGCKNIANNVEKTISFDLNNINIIKDAKVKLLDYMFLEYYKDTIENILTPASGNTNALVLNRFTISTFEEFMKQ